MTFVWVLLYRFYRLFSGLRYWVRRRFTRSGLVVLGGTLAAAGVGLDTENTVAYQAFTLLSGLLLLAGAFGWIFRARFAATRRLPRFGTVGHPLYYTVMLKNLNPKPQTGLTLLEELEDPRPSFAEWRAAHEADDQEIRSFRVTREARPARRQRVAVKESAVPSCEANAEAEIQAELLPLRRGLLRFAAVTLGRPDPLGLFRGFARVALPQTALILPRRYPIPPLGLPGRMQYQKGGVTLASNVGQSDEFVALRDYRPGDPLRHIHWRSWAKTGRPVVKEFEDEFFVRHALVLDTFTRRSDSDIFEEAVSVAASFASAIQTQESLLDLLFVGAQSYCCTAGRGLAQADQMLEILASVKPCTDREFQTLEPLVFNHISAVSSCICVLVAWDQERRDFVQKLKAFGVPLLVLVIAELDQVKAIEPGPMRDTPDQFHVLELGKIESGLARLGGL